MKPELSQAQLKELFEYREDGNLYWKQTKRGINLSKPAGTMRKNGYVQISVNRKIYLAHRLVFLMYHGYLPKEVDHIDGNEANNAIENLRLATPSQNMRNRGKQSNNKSGFKGVSWDKRKAKWRATIRINTVAKHLGYFDCPKEAHEAYCQAAAKYHGEFANFG
jgi:hypothetical protein